MRFFLDLFTAETAFIHAVGLLLCACILQIAGAHAGTGRDGSVRVRSAGVAAACIHGQSVSIDMLGMPAGYQVEIRYSTGVYVPLPVVSEWTGSVLQSRTAGILKFRCGDFAEYPEGPDVDGGLAGPAIGYRVTWTGIF